MHHEIEPKQKITVDMRKRLRKKGHMTTPITAKEAGRKGGLSKSQAKKKDAEYMKELAFYRHHGARLMKEVAERPLPEITKEQKQAMVIRYLLKRPEIRAAIFVETGEIFSAKDINEYIEWQRKEMLIDMIKNEIKAGK